MKNILVYKIAPLLAVLVITACGYFEMPDPPPLVVIENKDPEYFGAWIRQGDGDITYEIEIIRGYFIERTYEDGELLTDNRRAYNTIGTSSNSFFKYEFSFVTDGFGASLEFVDGGFKFGGGDIVYIDESKQNNSLNGTWSWENQNDYSLELTFVGYKNSVPGETRSPGILLMEMTYKPVHDSPPHTEWIGVNGTYTVGDNRLGISLSSTRLRRKLFKIENDKLIISDYYFSNGDIKEYNDNNLDSIDCEIFGLIFDPRGNRGNLILLQNYFAVKYNRK